jgi:hypothetical protein
LLIAAFFFVADPDITSPLMELHFGKFFDCIASLDFAFFFLQAMREKGTCNALFWTFGNKRSEYEAAIELF